MSTLKTINVIHPSGSTNNIVNDASGNVAVGNNLTVAGTATVTGTLAMASSFKRNRIINGNMQVWQRGTSFSGNVYTADRWVMGNNPTSIVQSTDVPTGFQYALDVTGANHLINQRIESFNILDTFGQSLTVSFWAKSVSGTNTLTVAVGTPSALNNFAAQNVEQTSSAITLSSSWAKYTVTFSSLTSSVANGAFIYIYRNGSTSTDQTRFTGVQLEVGTKATPYEMQIYSDQLAQCQRYYASLITGNTVFSGNITNGVNYYAQYILPVTMRVTPTVVTTDNGASGFGGAGAATPRGPNVITEGRTSNTSGSGYFGSNITATAEL